MVASLSTIFWQIPEAYYWSFAQLVPGQQDAAIQRESDSVYGGIVAQNPRNISSNTSGAECSVFMHENLRSHRVRLTWKTFGSSPYRPGLVHIFLYLNKFLTLPSSHYRKAHLYVYKF
ncbi:hypothetical protein Trydic_g13694 [Trypoxylus dichotomus]